MNEFVQWFRNASPYINAHRGRVMVIQFGGQVIQDGRFPLLAHDLALLSSLGIRLVLVHGIRAQIDARLARDGRASVIRNGLRITDDPTLELAKEAAGSVRVEIEALLSMGVANSPMHGARLRVTSGNFVTARPVGVREGTDYRHTGEVRRLDSSGIRAQLEAGNIVLVSPIGYSPTGEAFNLSAEQIATEIAIELGAAKLILIGDMQQGSPQLERQYTVAEARLALLRLKQAHGLEHELCLQLESAIRACHHNVTRAHLLDHSVDGGLLLELFQRDGIGVMVNTDTYEHIRSATIEDVGGVLTIIEPLEQQGVLVRRPREKLEKEIDRFTVVERDGMVIGCGALYPLGDEASVELTCVAVHPDYRGSGIGEQLLSWMLQQAESRLFKQILVLTTRTEQWFRERGFQRADIDDLPFDRRASYNYQRNSIVLVRTLAG